jgi:hypothetical protein
MATAPDTVQYQTRAIKWINEAIEEVIDRATEDAQAEWGGRRVRFTYHWYHNDVPTPVEGTITRVYFVQGDEDGPYYMLFEVLVRNPHTGQETMTTRAPGGFEFI